MIRTTIAGALALASVFAAAAAAQSPAPATSQPARATAWPKLEPRQQERIGELMKVFTMRKEDLYEQSHEELVAFGAGAAPLLIQRLTDFATNQNAQVRPVLDEITDASHATLIAKHARDQRVVVRHWVISRLASFADPSMAPVLKQGTKDKDADVQFEAALGLAGLGDLQAFDIVFDRCVADWGAVGKRVHAVLTPARGPAGTKWLVTRMAKAQFKEQVTCLKLLRALGTDEAKPVVVPLLDSSDHTLKREAINVLRAIVDGQPPLETLSVFDAIEQAKEWKRRV